MASEIIQNLPVTEEQKFTALDRCDACGAQAYAQVTFSTGTLMFCAHHFHKHEEKMALSAVSTRDETHRVLA